MENLSLFQENISLFAAFTAGIISFISPCVLPLIPAYLSFISGVSVEEMKSRDRKSEVLKKVSLNTILFILGFSVVFVALGASATFFGEFLLAKLSLFNKIAGVIIMILGVHLLGVFRIRFLDYEKRFHTKSRSLGLFGSFLVGLAFAFGWTDKGGGSFIFLFLGIGHSLLCDRSELSYLLVGIRLDKKALPNGGNRQRRILDYCGIFDIHWLLQFPDRISGSVNPLVLLFRKPIDKRQIAKIRNPFQFEAVVPL